ncbi:SDR family oxidoreductase [Luteimicrobium xylanilyticum]|uniref:3-hydroxybutyrate dehydrogenase n=1 Tax=Luteimicrobium xylanilyticum TaxID=1133546 RepID=A0A5P9QF13_9MICO|nr:SDR family oxidoreductase [Luteimicrobium xylanilyticum]QFV00045.1 3-hydroxybutyrate dehydrogenase [Luteimicrobium xylanilyticum]
MSRNILVTGAGSGFGRGAALELARRGHHVTAGVQIGPQATELLAAAREAGVELEAVVLDITDAGDRAAALGRPVDVLINSAGIMETGPVAEIPLDLVRRNYETNVFGTLAMCQGVARQMVERGEGKIINVTSMGGLITMPFAAIYTSTKHALEGLTEGLRTELSGTGVDVCTVNPGVYGTGFNDRGGETMLRWFDPATTLTRPELLAGLDTALDGQLDPQEVIDVIVRVAEEGASRFRNVVPEQIVPWIKAIQDRAWSAQTGEALFIDPTEVG